MARKAGGGMTVAEAGRMGGRLVSEKYGPEFYEKIGKKGGSSTANRYGPEFFGRIGKKGGRAVTAKYGAGHFERIGRKGGQKVADLIEEYASLGISEFILSGYPHLEEAYQVGEGLIPVLRRRGLMASPHYDD